MPGGALDTGDKVMNKIEKVSALKTFAFEEGEIGYKCYERRKH